MTDREKNEMADDWRFQYVNTDRLDAMTDDQLLDIANEAGPFPVIDYARHVLAQRAAEAAREHKTEGENR